MKALLPHSPGLNHSQKRPLDYVDPPRVVARRERILARWKAEGRPLTQPRLALSLAIARQAERYLGDSHWGHHTKGIGHNYRRDRAEMLRTLAKATHNSQRNHALKKPKLELAKARLINPYALPDKPMVRSGHTL